MMRSLACPGPQKARLKKINFQYEGQRRNQNHIGASVGWNWMIEVQVQNNRREFKLERFRDWLRAALFAFSHTDRVWYSLENNSLFQIAICDLLAQATEASN
jgi:hypothetical protein